MRTALIILTFVLLILTFNKWQAASSSEIVKNNQPLMSNKSKRSLKLLPSTSTRYQFHINGVKAQIPYAANRSLSEYNPKVNRLILAIHSSSYDANIYLNNVLDLSMQYQDLSEKLLIIAPALFRKDKTNIKNILTWKVSPFRGSSQAIYNGKHVRLSAYDIVDDLLTKTITSGRFPNIKDIVILGHSAGGQMVNRYAACSRFENTIAKQHHIKVKYLVMAPSSYLYFNNTRALSGTKDQFITPTNTPNYNNWGYGVQKLYEYHRRHNITAKYMLREYPKKEILYLVGNRDNIIDGSIGTSKGAMLQGPNRMERALIYYSHLKQQFGNNITRKQQLKVINGIGHWGKGLMSSEEGLQFIFY